MNIEDPSTWLLATQLIPITLCNDVIIELVHVV